MKPILCTLIVLIAFTSMLAAGENKSRNINETGMIETLPSNEEAIGFFSENGTRYFIWTDKVKEELKPHIDKKVKLNAQVIPTKNNNAEHIVWVNSVEVIE
jgi:hypothetical protein